MILFEDVRGEALDQLDGSLTERERTVAKQAVDHAMYGLMQVLDGVTGALRNDEYAVELQVTARLRHGEDIVHELDLLDSDGFCMGYHLWLEGEFGSHPIVERSDA